MSNQTIDNVLGPIDSDTRDISCKPASGAYWDSFDCQIQCEESYRYLGYDEDTYEAIQEYRKGIRST